MGHSAHPAPPSKSNTQTEQGESNGAEIRAVRLEKDMELRLSARKESHPSL